MNDKISESEDWKRGVTVLTCGHEVLDTNQVHYCDYVGLPLLEKLDRAFPGSHHVRDVLAPDEYQFLRVHHLCELIFLQILFDLPRLREAMNQDEPESALKVVKRMTMWMNLLQSVMEPFSTMTKEGFLAFRHMLTPGSGAESPNARKIEVLCGVPLDERYCLDRGVSYTYRGFLDRGPEPGQNKPKARWWTEELTRLSTEQTIWDSFIQLLGRRQALLEDLLKDSRGDWKTLCDLANSLHDFDLAYAGFRQAHLNAAAPFLTKPTTDEKKTESVNGTGHTDGIPFLRSTKDTRLFRQLWDVKHPKPKSDIP